MSRELRSAPSELNLNAINDLHERMCQLRITATVNVMGQLGHAVPASVTRQLTPAQIFREEEHIVTSQDSGLAHACQALVAATRGTLNSQEDDDYAQSQDSAMASVPATQPSGREPEAQYSDMETEEG